MMDRMIAASLLVRAYDLLGDIQVTLQSSPDLSMAQLRAKALQLESDFEEAGIEALIPKEPAQGWAQ